MPEPVRRRDARRLKRPLVMGVLGVIVVAAAAQSAHDHVAVQRSREPLRAAERAASATERPILTVPGDLLTRWSSTGGPVESKAIAATGPGNDLLEPAFYNSGSALELGPPSGRCYFLAASPSESFDPDTVTTLARACYLDPYKRAYSFSTRSVGSP